MKIIFDSETQKEKFISAMANFSECPSGFGLKNRVSIGKNCLPRGTTDCKRCWKNCGIEFEVKERDC